MDELTATKWERYRKYLDYSNLLVFNTISLYIALLECEEDKKDIDNQQQKQ
jgi:hypothetical protein